MAATGPRTADAERTKPAPSGGAAVAGARPFVPERPTLPALARAVQQCRGCDLYRNATQAVLGAGAPGARLLLVGEQPGDKEDLAGEPFVGPAGKLLDELLEAAGIARREIYLTNAVKHFKWEPRGRMRLHRKPTLREVTACRPWLEAEIAVVRPRGIVCLGATAYQALMGSKARVTRDRGRFFDMPWGGWVTPTLHPSAVLRMPDAARRREARGQLQHDLEGAARRLGAG